MHSYTINLRKNKDIFIFGITQGLNINIYIVSKETNDIKALLKALSEIYYNKSTVILYNSLYTYGNMFQFIIEKAKDLIQLDNTKLLEILNDKFDKFYNQKSIIKYYLNVIDIVNYLGSYDKSIEDLALYNTGEKYSFKCQLNTLCNSKDEIEQVRKNMLLEAVNILSIENNFTSDIVVRDRISKEIQKNLINAPISNVVENWLLSSAPVYNKPSETPYPIKCKDVILKGLKELDIPLLKEIIKVFESQELTESKKSFTYCCAIAGLNINFGIGGLHASKNGLFESDEYMNIVSLDFSSYYANLAIRCNIFPQTLEKIYFHSKLNELYELRSSDKSNERIYKNMLTSIYGLTAGESRIQDLWYSTAISINGQLITLYLMLSIYQNILGAFPIVVNTDGMEFMMPKNQLENFKLVIKDFRDKFNLPMKIKSYKKMIISNVNNYIAFNIDNSVKAIGKYAIEREFPKNKNLCGIAQMLMYYFRDNIKPEDSVKNIDKAYKVKINNGDIEKYTDEEMINLTRNEIKLLVPERNEEEY